MLRGAADPSQQPHAKRQRTSGSGGGSGDSQAPPPTQQQPQQPQPPQQQRIVLYVPRLASSSRAGIWHNSMANNPLSLLPGEVVQQAQHAARCTHAVVPDGGADPYSRLPPSLRPGAPDAPPGLQYVSEQWVIAGLRRGPQPIAGQYAPPPPPAAPAGPCAAGRGSRGHSSGDVSGQNDAAPAAAAAAAVAVAAAAAAAAEGPGSRSTAARRSSPPSARPSPACSSPSCPGSPGSGGGGEDEGEGEGEGGSAEAEEGRLGGSSLAEAAGGSDSEEEDDAEAAAAAQAAAAAGVERYWTEQRLQECAARAACMPELVPETERGDTADPTHFGVLGYNLWYAPVCEFERMCAVGAEIVRLGCPAVICLQEVTYALGRLLLMQPWAAKYGRSELYAPGTPGRRGFTMILWRRDLVKRARLLDRFRFQNDDPRVAEGTGGWHRDVLSLVGSIGGTPVRVSTSHLVYCGGGRAQLRETAGYLAQEPCPNEIFEDTNWREMWKGDYGPTIYGDMFRGLLKDAWLTVHWDPEARRMRPAGLADATWSGSQKGHSGRGARFDRLFHRLRDWRPAAALTVGRDPIPGLTRLLKPTARAERPVWPSDHYGESPGLYVEFERLPPPEAAAGTSGSGSGNQR